MATTTQKEEQLSLKLLVNKDTNKVLFAEAEKDFVDILCSFLTLPLGTIARLVRKQSNIVPMIAVGCLNSLYQSVENLESVTCKEMLLHPRKSCHCSTLKLNIDDTVPKKYFICTNFAVCAFTMLSSSANERCSCGNLLARPVFLNDFCHGFIKGHVTYIITDDLIVMPNSMDTSLGLLKKLGVKSTSSVKEITVNVTREKVLDLLKCSLLSKSTLTDLFLRKKLFLQQVSHFSPCGSQKSTDFRLKLKLAIRKSDGKILYAQGEKDFVNLLLSFLTLPIGGVLHLLGGNCSVGNIDGLYRSMGDLAEKYFMSKQVKNRLVDPCVILHFKLRKMLPIHKHHVPFYYGLFCLYQHSREVSVRCNQFFITDHYLRYSENYSTMNLVDSTRTEINDVGLVRELEIYMVTDDLVVSPMSVISAMHYLDRLKTPLSDLKEKVVTIGIKECLGILKASLSSTSALTNALSHLLLSEVKEEK